MDPSKNNTMDPVLGSALIAGAGSLISGVIGSNTSSKNLKRQMEFNHNEAQIARDWQESMWNKSNEYNTPTQQMQRLTEAGLNPNLVYGNGADATAAGVPTASSGTNAGNLQQRVYFDPGSAIQQGINTYFQTKMLQEQADKARSESWYVAEQARGKALENDARQSSGYYTDEANKMKSEAALAQVRSDLEDRTINQKVQIYNNMANLGSKEVEISSKRYEYLDEQLRASCLSLWQDLSNKIKTGELISSEVALNTARTSATYEQISVFRAQVKELLTRADLNVQQKNNLKKLGDKTDAEIAKIFNDMRMAVLQGKLDAINTYSKMFGTGLVDQVVKNVHGLVGGAYNDVMESLDDIYKDFDY